MAKLPAIQFYPGDWRKDLGVQSLSFHDRGVWFEMLLLMHESEVRGKLLLGGKAMTDELLAGVLHIDLDTLSETIETLLKRGVTERDKRSGALVNRRMIRDENINAENRARLNKWRKTKKTQGNGNAGETESETEMIRLPSSSSSSSSSSSTSVSNGLSTGEDFEGTELSVANGILMNLSIPGGERLLQLVAQALAFEGKRLGSAQKAIDSLEQAMKSVKGTGVKWFLWFQDQGYLPQKPQNRNGVPIPAAHPSQEKQNADDERAREMWESMSDVYREAHPWKA